MRFLLDTNDLSDARRSASPALDAWLASQMVGDLAISAITPLEIEIGVRRKERIDSRSGTHLRRWLEESVRPMFADRVLPVDEAVALEAARLQVPDPMPETDGLIAATALAHKLTLVTRNRRDMERTGVALMDPRAL